MAATQDWLASFNKTEFIMNDSFYGIVFSITFDNPFLVIMKKEHGATKLEPLLEKIGGLNHLVYNSLNVNNGSKNVNNLESLDKSRLNYLK